MLYWQIWVYGVQQRQGLKETMVQQAWHVFGLQAKCVIHFSRVHFKSKQLTRAGHFQLIDIFEEDAVPRVEDVGQRGTHGR